jgi:hypothetical protein
MFRLIGIVVVVFVMVIGWTQIKKVYNGGMSGKEAITEIREKSADVLRSKPEGNHEAQTAKPAQPNAPAEPAENDPFSMANQLLSK